MQPKDYFYLVISFANVLLSVIAFLSTANIRKNTRASEDIKNDLKYTLSEFDKALWVSLRKEFPAADQFRERITRLENADEKLDAKWTNELLKLENVTDKLESISGSLKAQLDLTTADVNNRLTRNTDLITILMKEMLRNRKPGFVDMELST